MLEILKDILISKLRKEEQNTIKLRWQVEMLRKKLEKAKQQDSESKSK